ncbi:MAG TPA: hypothetical protein VEA99_02100 [Gemmatimonadaceae bacterium]|nr:hypothetical protein [Gemmatimonadaceae bacterium]
MVETLFELLFKYRPPVFANGRFAMGTPGPLLAALVVVAILAVAAAMTYARAGTRTALLARRDRVVLGALRLAALALLVLCLSRPRLLLSEAVPQRNYVGVLLDDSRSMQIADVGSAPRSTFVRQTFDSATGSVMRALADRFRVRSYGFSREMERVGGAAQLAFTGQETRVGEALEQAREALGSVPLAGLVVVTDGADNARTPMAERLLALRAHGVPIYTVGVGRERFARDVEVRRVDAPRHALEGSSLVVDVLVAQQGYAGRTVPVLVEDEGRIVGRQEVTLPAGRDAAVVRVNVTASEAGARTLTVRVPAQAGEEVAQNNVRSALVDVRGGRRKILYVEGEPRFEVKFVRRAVADDSLLQLVVLQRTADHKFLRLSVDSGEELASGFPATREELFGYTGIVLGSIEASFFTADQLRMLADFVSERGGGLLALGGPRALAEGGLADTPLADALPVSLPRGGARSADEEPVVTDLAVAPTPVGRAHPVTQIAGSDSASAARWRSFPAVTSVNAIGALKPGAVALLTGRVPDGGRGRASDLPVLAVQSFGRGRAATLAIQDSWLWQMDATVSIEDESHETFWRQLLRWLVSETPGRVATTLSADRVGPREAVTVRADVRDARYLGVNDARVLARVVAPSGVERMVPLSWTVERDGEYSGSFTADEPGRYAVHVAARTRADSVAASAAPLEVAEPQEEYFGAEMRGALLRRIAEETGGRFYTPETVRNLAEDIALGGRGVTVVREMDLWDMPVVFLLLVALLGGEWGYRRWRKLA